MGKKRVEDFLKPFGRADDILEMDSSTATVALAAEALGIIPARIAKTIALEGGKEPAILVVAAGDARVDNRKFREEFGHKASMLSPDKTKKTTGYAVGGVCPFALPEEITVVFDESLKRFESVYPACGTATTAIEMTIPQLEKMISNHRWVDVCSGWKNK